MKTLNLALASILLYSSACSRPSDRFVEEPVTPEIEELNAAHANNVALLTGDSFEDYIASGRAVVDFGAPWCGPCRTYEPIFEKVARTTPGTRFGKVNTDNDPGLEKTYGIWVIPTTIFFCDGEEIHRRKGLQRDLGEYVDSVFSECPTH